MDYLEKLNKYQRAAVLDESDACIVNAMVGSGKTTVLISKVMYLHEVKKVPYEDMIVLTFTNKAADEIKDRLRAERKNQDDEDVQITQKLLLTQENELRGFGTFHSVALYFLREVLPIETLGYAKDFTVITPEEEVELGLLLMEENGLKIKYKNRLKKRLEQERPAYEKGKKEARYKDDLFKLMRLLGQEKLRQSKFTFRDLIRVSNYLLKKEIAQNKKRMLSLENPNSQRKIEVAQGDNESIDSRNHEFCPQWIIVDEVQDSDEIQIEFMENLRNLGNVKLAGGIDGAGIDGASGIDGAGIDGASGIDSAGEIDGASGANSVSGANSASEVNDSGIDRNQRAHFFAVGDPNQVIYSWRGSSSNIFYQLKERFGAKEMKLPLNYRSSGAILAAASCFQQNPGELSGTRERGERILVKNHYNSFQEAQYLAQKIKELCVGNVVNTRTPSSYRNESVGGGNVAISFNKHVGGGNAVTSINESVGGYNHGVSYKDIAIFYRLQSQSEQLEKVFKAEGIPYEISVKKTIQDIPVLNWLLYVLRAACNEKDLLAQKKATSDSVYGIIEPAKQKGSVRKNPLEKSDFEEALSQEKKNAESALSQEKKNIGSTLSNEKWNYEDIVLLENWKFLQRIQYFKKVFSPENLENKIVDSQYIYNYFDLDLNLRPTSAQYQDDKEMVLDMLNRMLEYCLENHLGILDGFQEFLNSSALYGTQILKKEVDLQEDSVKLMTLHASKGLEFSRVYIIGVNYGLIPLQAKGFEEEDEERRLFFVGMTRAKDYLELSCYTNPDQVRVMPGESRFIRMIPEELIQSERKVFEKVDLQKMRKEVEKSSMVQPLAMLFGVEEESSDRFAKNTGKKSLDNRFANVEEYEDSELEPDNEIDFEENAKWVRHAKYGTGFVTSEDDTMIEAEFENYGKKQFVKAFSELEYL